MDINKIKPICFYASPIGQKNSKIRKKTDEIIEKTIKPALKDDFDLVFPHEINSAGIITDEIVEYMKTAELVIFNLTGNNPNVYYELGLRLRANKPYILLAEEKQRLPFDVTTERTFHYVHSGEGLSELKDSLLEIANTTVNDRKYKPAFAPYLGNWLQILLNFNERPLAIMKISYDAKSNEYHMEGINYHKNCRAEDKFFTSDIMIDMKCRRPEMVYVTHRSSEDIIGTGKIVFHTILSGTFMTADCSFIDKNADNISLKNTKMIKCNEAFYNYLGIQEPEYMDGLQLLRHEKTQELIKMFCDDIEFG